MKFSTPLAVILLCWMGAAAAQGNVTIYGRLNTSVERQTDKVGKTVYVLANNSSRIGFRALKTWAVA